MARAQWPDVTTAARRVRWGRGGSKTGGCACAVGVGMESVTRARDARCLTSRERAMSLELQRRQLPVGGALCWARGRAPLDVSVGGVGKLERGRLSEARTGGLLSSSPLRRGRLSPPSATMAELGCRS